MPAILTDTAAMRFHVHSPGPLLANGVQRGIDFATGRGYIEIESQNQRKLWPGERMKKEPLKHRFRQYLSERGLSLTQQRSLILDYLSQDCSHFDADDLFSSMRKRNIAVSRATVYRTLGHLRDAGFIRKVELDTPHAHFEFVAGGEHHEHLVCEACGHIVEFTDPVLEGRIEALSIDAGFSPTRHTVQIFGICLGCREHKEA